MAVLNALPTAHDDSTACTLTAAITTAWHSGVAALEAADGAAHAAHLHSMPPSANMHVLCGRDCGLEMHCRWCWCMQGCWNQLSRTQTRCWASMPWMRRADPTAMG